MCIFLVFNLEIPYIFYVEQILIYLATLLTVISLVDYLWKNKSVLQEKNM